jgi:hypothetical protein
MKPLLANSLGALTLGLLGAVALAAPPPEQTVREVFVQVRTVADTNQDGALSVEECTSLLTDRQQAQRNCRFWDADKDGILTEDEYVERVGRVTGRRP